jgi:hypothetical protein
MNAMKGKIAHLVDGLETRIVFLEREVEVAEARGRQRAMYHVRDRTTAFIDAAAAMLQREGMTAANAHAVAAELHDVMKAAVLGNES